MMKCLKSIAAVLMAGMIWAGGCVDNPVSDDSVTYVVETINGKPPTGDGLDGWLSPFEIRLIDHPPKSDYAGSVMFAQIGWVDIGEANKERFQVTVRGGLHDTIGVEYIAFTRLSLDASFLTGWMGLGGATIDAMGPWEFRAVIKE